MPYILSIESSCDDTSAAIMEDCFVRSNIIASQKVHERYGGVVPELASRAHQQNIVPVVDTAIKEAGIAKEDLHAIAFTRGPGLLGSLLVGVSFAKTFALSLNKPLIEVNHLDAHVLAHFIKERPDSQVPECPFLCLLVSGGNTQIIKVNAPRSMEIIGQTIDDAAGEAIDKAAKIMGLPYPGGPHIDKLAKAGNPMRFQFAKPHIPNYDYSFSGLKTSILYFLRDRLKTNSHFIDENLNDLCASVQHTITNLLMQKFMKAVEDTNIKTIAVSGGVSANSALRNALMTEGEKRHLKVFIPPFQYCTDNAAMVGIAGYFKYLNNEFASLDLAPYAR